MKSAITKFKFLFPALALLSISSCKNTPDNIPFPENETEFPQPVSKPLKFSDVKKLNWSNDDSTIKPVIKKFDFNKLPEKVYDSSGFQPFSKKPDSVKFDWDKLPDTVFDYNKLPSIPLKFQTSLLPPPELIPAGPPRLIKGTSNIIYELGESQGLKVNFIESIFEDKAGFLWISTDKGLYRYDGENLELYYHSPTQYVYSVLEDTHGQIWMTVRHFQGGVIYSIEIIDPKEGIIKNLIAPNGFGKSGILPCLLDSKGRIWARIASGGLIIIDENSGTIKQLNKTHGLSENLENAMMEDNKNNIWISTPPGISILDLKNKKIKYLNNSQDTIEAVQQDNMSRVWLAGLNGRLHSVDIKKGTIINYDNGKNSHFEFTGYLFIDKKGNIWTGDTNTRPAKGIKVIDPVRGLIKTVNISDGLSGNGIQGIVQDKRGQIWIATDADVGLNMVNRNGNDIHHIGKTDITTLAEDSKGKIWIGNSGAGIDILDTATGLSRSFTKAQGLGGKMQNMVADDVNIFIGTDGGIDIIDSSRKKIEHIGKLQGLSTNTIEGILKDNSGMLWVAGFFGVGVDILDLQKNTIHHIGTTQGLNDTSVINIAQDIHGRVWFTSRVSGGGIIDTKTNTIKYLNNLPGLTHRDNNKPLLEDKQGNMWIGTSQGIYIINAKTDSFFLFSTREGLLSNNILSLNSYNDRIFIGTWGGINILTPPNAKQKIWKIESYGKAQGISKLVDGTNSDIITKNGKFLWGDKGITILNNLAEDTVVCKTYITGIDIFNLPQYFSNNPWPYLSEKDTLWSSTKDSFYVNGNLPASNKMKWDSVTTPYNMPVNLSLDYDDNYLQFYFSQFNSGSVDQTWYRYILEGIDKSWSNKIANAYSENYLNLPPGNYTFKVCSEGSNGLWGKPAELQFTILPPWWKTWWAYTIYALFFVILVWSFAIYRSQKLHRENRILEEKVATRTNELKQEKEKVESTLQELKSTQAQLIQSEKMASLGELTAGIAHEIQNPLNFVNNFSEVNTELIDEMQEEINKANIEAVKAIANDIKENEQKINHHGKRADAIVKGMLQHSRSSTGVKELTDINALADEYLRLSYHGLRAKDKTFNAILKTDFDTSLEKIKIIPQDVGRVILNLFTNAFYSVTEKNKLPVKGRPPDGQGYEPTVSVSTKNLGDKAEIRVTDNGMGIPQKIVDKIFQPFFSTKPTGQGTGLGLSLSYDIIIKEHKGQLKVETKEGEFAEFIILLPYN